MNAPEEVLTSYSNETLSSEEPGNLFAVGQKWLDKSALTTAFEKYCTMQNVKLIKTGEGSNTLRCNRAGKRKDRKKADGTLYGKRDFKSGDLQCGCEFFLQMKSTQQRIEEEKSGQKTKSRKKDVFDIVNVLVLNQLQHEIKQMLTLLMISRT